MTVASKNSDKIKEIEEVLGSLGLVDEIVSGLEWNDVDETGSTLEENALLKARAVVEATAAAGRGFPLDLERHGRAPRSRRRDPQHLRASDAARRIAHRADLELAAQQLLDPRDRYAAARGLLRRFAPPRQIGQRDLRWR